MRSKVTAQIYDGDEMIGDELEYSIESYAAVIVNSSVSDTVKQLVIKMMKFGLAAEAYFS